MRNNPVLVGMILGLFTLFLVVPFFLYNPVVNQSSLETSRLSVENAYGIYLKIPDEIYHYELVLKACTPEGDPKNLDMKYSRSEKTHHSEVRIEIGEESREMTWDEFKTRILTE